MGAIFCVRVKCFALLLHISKIITNFDSSKIPLNRLIGSDEQNFTLTIYRTHILSIMEIWLYWVLAALLLFIVELFTSGFAVICLAIGALGGAIAALCDGGIEIQFAAFVVVSIIAIFLLRPALKRLFFRKGEKVVTNANAIIGKRGVVCVDIEADDDNGRVVIDGMDWRAKSADNEPLAKGTKVEVVAIDSVILTVKRL